MEKKVVIPEMHPYMIRIKGAFIKQMIYSAGSNVSAFAKGLGEEHVDAHRNYIRFNSWLTHGKMPVLKVLQTARHLAMEPEHIVIDEDVERLTDRIDRIIRFKEAHIRYDKGIIDIEAFLVEVDETLPYFLQERGTDWYDKDGNLIAAHDRWVFLKNRRIMENNYGKQARLQART